MEYRPAWPGVPAPQGEMDLSIEKLIYGGDGLARAPARPRWPQHGCICARLFAGGARRSRSSGKGSRALRAQPLRTWPSHRRSVLLLAALTSSTAEAATTSTFPTSGSSSSNCRYFARLRACRENYATGEIRVHPSPPWNTAIDTPPGEDASDFALGYFSFGSREFLPVRECPISSPLINRRLPANRAGRIKLSGGSRGAGAIRRRRRRTPARLVLLWARSDRERFLAWAEAIQRQLPDWLAAFLFFAARLEDEAPPELKPLAGVGANAIGYRTGSAEYQVIVGSFFQVNRHLIDELVSVVTANISGDAALDLYAGVGLFSVPLSRRIHHIFAVEASQTSFVDLRQNVPASVKAVGALAEDYLRSRHVRRRPELVVLDPPRAGAGKAVTRSLIELGAQRIRYSCDRATLARDLAPLLAAGYRIEEAHLFDLFPQTFHIESVILLAR